MSPTLPPDTHEVDSGQTAASPLSDDRRETLRGNSYTDSVSGREQPDLNRGAVDLRKTEQASMNRKALGLLACIITLLAVMGYWLVTDKHTEAPRAAPQETVSVPDAPDHAPAEAATPQSPPTPESIRIEARDARGASPVMSLGEQPLLRESTLLERRIAASNNGTTGIASAPSREMPGFQLPPGAFGTEVPAKPSMSASNNLAYSANALPDIASADPLPHPDAVLLQGTLIRCVLQTRIITDIPGFTSCVVTEPVYSFTGKRLLLSKGSKVMGKYEMEPNGSRVAVIWTRIVTPDGVDVNMASPGIDDLGGAGHPGHYSAHWGQRITSALLISLMSDAFKYAAAEHGPRTTTITNGLVTDRPFESNTSETLHELASSAVRRGADRPATVTINQGTVLAIYVAKDVDFTAVVAGQ